MGTLNSSHRSFPEDLKQENQTNDTIQNTNYNNNNNNNNNNNLFNMNNYDVDLFNPSTTDMTSSTPMDFLMMDLAQHTASNGGPSHSDLLNQFGSNINMTSPVLDFQH